MSQSLPSNPSTAFVERNPHLYKGTTKVEPNAEPKRIRQNSKPLMNKLEEEFSRVLQNRNHHYSVIYAQKIRFQLGNGVAYKPDFVCFKWSAESRQAERDPITGLVVPALWKCPYAWEVKGPHAFRGGFENLKVAASLYPEIKWVLVWKHEGQWCEQLVLP